MKQITLYLLLLAACACNVGVKPQPVLETGSKTVFLVAHGWHSGMVIKRADIPVDLLPERGDFPQAEYLELGWGERDFYRAPEVGFWLTLKAALWRNASVLHVVGFDGQVTHYFPQAEILQLDLSESSFLALIRYIDASFARGDAPSAAALGAGLYGDSKFYASGETFHLFKTCNVWLARALRAAGLDMTPSLALTTTALMKQASRHGRALQACTPEHAKSCKNL